MEQGKQPSAERVVGNLSKEEKHQISFDIEDRFNNQPLEEVEREKTPVELEIISMTNQLTNEVRQSYGLADFDIPSSNIHVVPESKWPEAHKGNNAFFSSIAQGIAAEAQPSNMVFAKNIFHEMIHFKSYNAFQITTGEDPILTEYRAGLVINNRAGDQRYFTNLDEAIVEGITMRYAKKLFSNPLFANEIDQTNNVIAENLHAIDVFGNPLFSDETYYAHVNDEETIKFTDESLSHRDLEINIEEFSYKEERQILGTLIDKIVQKNYDKFNSTEEVFEIFAKASMTGNVMPMGRVVDNTFGIGTLRQIGELDGDLMAQKGFVDSIK